MVKRYKRKYINKQTKYIIEEIHEDWCKGIIIPVCKQKGDKTDCNNDRGITLLSIYGKVYTNVIREKLRIHVEQVIGEKKPASWFQSWKKHNRSTIHIKTADREVY